MGAQLSALDREFPDCPGCGRDLVGLHRAVFCPGCGRQLQFKTRLREQVILLAIASFHKVTLGRFDPPPPAISTDRAPITIGYSNAMFKLGHRYERSGFRNLGEALRCYRKSARLGNRDAAVRLTEEMPEPLRVLPIRAGR